ncbi:DUF302 domain-containing protein [Szabonella alba]|uniref:DUF302 domain-containing protein n=1 Tax=Szabonella alba TaxID=2804194 RepID=A0A8K0Y1W2_9RHOB|nr:DUF302 domain-containing protein [Szabonella alba]MBL4916474.1 DUF302 domain-containing protein [Szabonella alba]
MMFRTALLCTLLATTPVLAGEFETYETDLSFEDATFAIENAILGEGLVIDSVSHVGEMLERTKADIGATATIFAAADVFQFCSARVSREVMEADPANLRFCPYGIHVWQMPDSETVLVGHDRYEGTMAPVQDLLSGIVKEALELD